MSALDELLEEEYERSQRMLAAMEHELALLPRGYLSCKKINGRQYYYLQSREQGRIVSCYVKPQEVEELKEQIQRRRSLQASVRECRQNIKKIERVLKNGKHEV